MERLTMKFPNGYLFKLPSRNDEKAQEEFVNKLSEKLGQYEDAEELCIEECGCSLRMVIEKYKEFLEDMVELAEYRQAEEQGLLLRLPCKVGSTLYQPINSHINEYKVIGLCFDIFQNKWMYEVAYEVVCEWFKTTCDFDVIGKTVFLTREEAEQALAEMQKG